jgi:hypothetical protein
MQFVALAKIILIFWLKPVYFPIISPSAEANGNEIDFLLDHILPQQNFF